MSAKKFQIRSVSVLLAAAAALNAGAASAIEFQFGESSLKVDNLLTFGASWRMQERDGDLIGKSSLYRLQNPGSTQGLCFTRAGDDGVSGANPALNNGEKNAGTYTVGAIPAACSFSDATAAPLYRDAPGSFAPNGDNGNLNFDKGDIVHAVAKLTTDISFNISDYNFFMRPIYYFDANYTRFEETHPDTTFYPRSTELPQDVKRQVGSNLEMLDYHVSTSFDVLDRSISLKVGNQVLNWGESSLLLFNSLNTVNALDATKIRFPGSDLKEFFQPQGMVLAGVDVMESVSLESWYAYEFKEARIDPVGTYFSQSDTLGAGGTHAMLGFGKNPDDPLGTYEAIDTCPAAGPCVDAGGGLIGSTSSRTIYRNFDEERERRPDDGGYGVAMKTFLEDFNNGTEVAFYYAEYPSRFPIASFIAAEATCIGQNNPGTPVLDLQPGGACQVTPGGGDAANNEPLPVDTAQIVIEYPESIDLYGMSFNTTIGDYALSGEYAYRPNLPVQIHTTDLTLAALNPALPADEVNLGAAAIPGRRQSFPDFVSVYRGVTTASNAGYGPNDYIRGYERLEVGQANLTVLRLIGGDNPIGASQMTMLFEMGMNQVFNMPGIRELQFQGGGNDTHISDGSVAGDDGINPDDPYIDQSTVPNARRQNPVPHRDLEGFGTSESYGYRFLNLNRWDSALFGANLETLTIVQHDVKGTTPGIGTNFVQGRKQYAFGLRFDYLSTWIGEVRYSWNTGGAKRDALRDRDNIAVSLGVQF